MSARIEMTLDRYLSARMAADRERGEVVSARQVKVTIRSREFARLGIEGASCRHCGSDFDRVGCNARLAVPAQRLRSCDVVCQQIALTVPAQRLRSCDIAVPAQGLRTCDPRSGRGN